MEWRCRTWQWIFTSVVASTVISNCLKKISLEVFHKYNCLLYLYHKQIALLC